MAQLNRAFAERVLREVERSGRDVMVEPTVGGLVPDLVVALSNGQNVILEAKAWDPSDVNVQRAEQQAALYREQLGIDTYVVMPASPPDETAAVVGVDHLLDFLAERERWRHKASHPSSPVEGAKAVMFCAMPFDPSYDDVFFVAMRKAAEKAGLAARRVDQDEFADDIVDRILKLIDQAVLVVADLSESKPNVMYEAGYARGKGKPVVAVCSTPLDKLPFDVAHNNTLEYVRGQTHALVDPLRGRIEAVLPD